ncbi:MULTISPECIES: alpha/beta hydrolase [unclassified Campylobacter]|uniref:alpha/beta hydrolase n=1 Tax=unclassified Campylobacter TaxID=2593542 RepID=UPI001474B720|nr:MULTISPECIES: alpha/beta hydrolase [unclassified Campylobacter]QKG29963.1 alpha/beta hydrolase family protein [Campylobacter sp. RM16187]
MNIFKFKDGKEMSYVDLGSKFKRAIVIHHGIATSPIDEDEWNRFCNDREIRMILPNRSGHDGSSYFYESSYIELAKRFDELLSSIGVKKFSVIGISAGAPHAYANAIVSAKKAHRVYIYSGLGALYDDEVLKGYGEYYDEINELYRFARENSQEDIGKIYLQKYGQSYGDDYLKQLIKERYIAMGYDIKLQAMPWGFRIEDVKQPITIRHSIADNEVPYEAALKTANLIKNVKFISVQNDPHFTVESIVEFIDMIISEF